MCKECCFIRNNVVGEYDPDIMTFWKWNMLMLMFVMFKIVFSGGNGWTVFLNIYNRGIGQL